MYMDHTAFDWIKTSRSETKKEPHKNQENNASAPFILASASPRRTELLTLAGIEHNVHPSRCEERITKDIPYEVVMELSKQKAEDVYRSYVELPNVTVLGSDTVVAAKGKILGKPKSEADTFEMLSMLQGNTHQVYTGVTLLCNRNGVKSELTFYECSEVHVYPMSDAEITHYIESGEPFDKAGGYGIQGPFAIYIKGIQGDYNNIVGLPIARIYQELKQWQRS